MDIEAVKAWAKAMRAKVGGPEVMGPMAVVVLGGVERVEALVGEVERLREAAHQAYPILQYFYPGGEQHVNSTPSRRAGREALLAVRAALNPLPPPPMVSP